ncbi:hypothetical protein GCM10023195_44630 [Actinoallomurus liliacearum]|uniref:Uncharacterized protein n=1 Tax=Actinoallomurus liliacearum TaxID=1080073 RepID=A0ABP8TND5_9ACTN
MAGVTFRDETATGRRFDEMSLPGLPDRVTVRDLIRLRVREEVARHNGRPSRHFRGLVRPEDAEVELNGYRLREPRPIDWERQADLAERAFRRNGFFLLVGDRQADDLDQVVELSADTEVVFIRVVQLVGG